MILIHLIVGIICTSMIFLLVRFAEKRGIKIKIWQWILAVMEIAFIAFVLELIISFIDEENGKAALVMGSIFGFLAIIGAVLIARFVFGAKTYKYE